MRYSQKEIVPKLHPIQTLEELSLWNKEDFERAMEIVELLVACSWHSFKIQVTEVAHVRVGKWFEEMLQRLWHGVHGVAVDEGLYLPFYIVLRAIHPKCPDLDKIPRFDLSFAEEVVIYWLEPRLFEGTWGELNLFPPAVEDGQNYNLWYYYDCLQPEPF